MPLIFGERQIQCADGFSYNMGPFTHDSWNITVCKSNTSRCFFGNGTIKVDYISVLLNGFGLCMDNQVCETFTNAGCDQVINYFIDGNTDLQSYAEIFNFTIESCSFSCCDTDRCNQPATKPITTTIVTTTKSESTVRSKGSFLKISFVKLFILLQFLIF